MVLLTRVRKLIGDRERIYECRHCGCTLESDIEDCPQCGTNDIAVYDLE